MEGRRKKKKASTGSQFAHFNSGWGSGRYGEGGRNELGLTETVPRPGLCLPCRNPDPRQAVAHLDESANIEAALGLREEPVSLNLQP